MDDRSQRMQRARGACADLVRRCREAPAAPAGELTAPLEHLLVQLEALGEEGPADGAPDRPHDAERLRALTTRLLLVEETERRRLACELHDGLGQAIALARMRYAALRPSADDALGASLDEIADLIEQADRSARALTFALSPPTLHTLGLVPALEWLVEDVTARYGLPVALEDDGRDKPADEQTRVIFFRAIRELLINAAKHARAARASVSVRADGATLHAEVRDDGVGMDLEACRDGGHGLFSIEERMRHVGGDMTVESAPGRGTCVRLSAPLGRDGALQGVRDA